MGSGTAARSGRIERESEFRRVKGYSQVTKHIAELEAATADGPRLPEIPPAVTA